MTRMRKIHKGLMRWEDIENSENLESAIENNQNSFLPQELLNNLRNNNLNNAQNSNQNSKPINTSSNLIPTSQITNPINVNITTESIVKNDDFDEMNEENYEENFEEDIPAEIMNAPDIEVDVIEEDDVFDIETYELERDRKKIKNDEERTL